MSDSPPAATSAPPPAAAPRRARWVTPTLVAVVCLVLFLRHDWWNWRTPGYLLFGFLPVGLWWQALVSILASGMMWLMVRLAWPTHLEAAAEDQTPPAPPPAAPAPPAGAPAARRPGD